MMVSPTVEAQDFWGYLVNSDKTPTPRLEDLLLGIAYYIKKQVAPWDVRELTPIKLAAFYKLVGGNYDTVFLETPHPSLSFIYRSLGCFHSLQPDTDPYVVPSVPAMTPKGFVRWQTIQLLLEPGEHVAYLQEAVKRLDIRNPGEGGPFPTFLPAEAFPSKPDIEMTQWHDMALERLRPTPAVEQTMNADDVEVELESSTNSSVEGGTTDGRDDFVPRRGSRYGRSPPRPIRTASHHPHHGQHSQERPTHHHHRRRSMPDKRNDDDQHWTSDIPTPRGPSSQQQTPRTARPRSPSYLSTTSSEIADQESSFTGSEASPTIPMRHVQGPGLKPSLNQYGRRHSAHDVHRQRDYSPAEESRRQNLSPPFYVHQQAQPQTVLSREGGSRRGSDYRGRDLRDDPRISPRADDDPSRNGTHSDMRQRGITCAVPGWLLQEERPSQRPTNSGTRLDGAYRYVPDKYRR